MNLEWDQVRSFADERCAVKKGEQWFYVNKQGQIITDLSCDAVCKIYDSEFYEFEEGIIVDNIVYGIAGNIKVPASEVLCEYNGGLTMVD